MPTVSQSLISFLTARKAQHNGPDLLDRYLQHAPNVETQVNVAAGKGWPVDGKRSTYTDGLDEWFNIRIPKDANSEPHFKDYELRFPLDLHADAIGWTGWDWAARKSRALGFDFDSITGHAAGIGVSDEELERVKEAACALPFVEVRRSTGGNGIHLYVYFDDAGVPTENHTIHAALGRAVLGMMSSETGFDFSSHIDACGSNMWVWARKMTTENQGLALVKAQERPLTTADLPANWRDHVEVVTRKRSKIRINGVEEAGSVDPFEELANSRRIIPLDEKHKQIIDELRQTGHTTVWVPDYHMLQTHTCALKQLMDEKREELNLVGFFDTISPGRNPGEQNCFAFPLDNGGWKVYLYGQGRQEANTWEQDGQGWTTCYFNRRPNLKVAARAMGGVEDGEKGGFEFETAIKANEAAEALGRKLPIPESMQHRKTTLKASKDGRLLAKIERQDGDTGEMKQKGWQAKKGYWLQIFETKTDNRSADLKIAEFDNVIRALKTPSEDRAGWKMLDESGKWVGVPREEAKGALLALGHSKPEADVILGMAGKRNWSIVNLPFQPEFPGNRQWNQGAAQLVVTPASDDELAHPNWDKYLSHLTQSIDEAVKLHPWCREHKVFTGRHWIMLWIACLIRHPFDKLPAIWSWGPEGSGKSMYWEILRFLMSDSAVCEANSALANDSGFNSEIANAVLAYIEELNLTAAKHAQTRFKQWITDPTLLVHAKRCTPYSIASTLHFYGSGNSPDNALFGHGDTRTTFLYVPKPANPKPKGEFLAEIKAEASHFLAALLRLDIPPAADRLRIPMIESAAKSQVADSKQPLRVWFRERVELSLSARIIKAVLYQDYVSWADGQDAPTLSKIDFGRQLRLVAERDFTVGKMEDADGKRRDAYLGITLKQAA